MTKLRRIIITPLLKLKKLGIMLPLKDNEGREIGILALGFKYHEDGDMVVPFKEAIAIRDKISASIVNPAQLMKSVN